MPGGGGTCQNQAKNHRGDGAVGSLPGWRMIAFLGCQELLAGYSTFWQHSIAKNREASGLHRPVGAHTVWPDPSPGWPDAVHGLGAASLRLLAGGLLPGLVGFGLCSRVFAALQSLPVLADLARAVQIIDYIKTTIQDDPLRRKEISFDSQQARILFSGAGGEPVSRRDTIRAMRRAEKLWPALICGHRPNDGRQTTRLIGKTEDMKDSPVIGYRSLWQRSSRRVGMSL